MAGRDASEPLCAAACSHWRTAVDGRTGRAPFDVEARSLSRSESGGVGARATSAPSPSDSELDESEITAR